MTNGQFIDAEAECRATVEKQCMIIGCVNGDVEFAQCIGFGVGNQIAAQAFGVGQIHGHAVDACAG